MMSRRELIRGVFEGRRSERLPRALFGAGLWSFRQAGLQIEELIESPSRFGTGLAAVFSSLDTDIVFAGSGLNTLPAEAIGGMLAFRGRQAPLLSHPIIEKTDDARYFAEVSLNDAPHAQALVQMIAGMRSQLPDRFLCATSWGPFTWAMILCEWNLLREKTSTDREFIREVCELGVRLSCSLFGPLAEQGLIDGISVPDGAVTLIPPDLYQEVVMPCEQKLFAWARERGLRSFLHQCGDIRAQFRLYPDTGADCVSLDACVPVSEAYGLYRHRVVTAGNVDVINVIFAGDAGRIRQAVSACVGSVSDPLHRYILMPSCDLPVETPLEHAQAFLAAADGP